MMIWITVYLVQVSHKGLSHHFPYKSLNHNILSFYESVDTFYTHTHKENWCNTTCLSDRCQGRRPCYRYFLVLTSLGDCSTCVLVKKWKQHAQRCSGEVQQVRLCISAFPLGPLHLQLSVGASHGQEILHGWWNPNLWPFDPHSEVLTTKQPWLVLVTWN